MEGSSAKEILDRAGAAVALLLSLPLGLIVAIAVLADDGWPAFFSQKRVGRYGRPFRLWKFRSMRRNASGLAVTAEGDPRLTRTGKLLRRYKLDELPQFWNVLRGEMSLIGPRPEVPVYVDLGDPVWRAVLSVKPGMTDATTLLFRHEERMLARAADPDRLYREIVLPAKLALSLRYVGARALRLDLMILLVTLYYSLVPSGMNQQRLRAILKMES